MVLLPSNTTLQSYTGPTTGELGVTNLIRKRVKLEVDNLLPIQRIGSLKIDGMHIKQSQSYLRNIDQLVGGVDMGGVQVEGVNDDTNNLATDFLVFVVEGRNDLFIVK